MSRPLVDFTHDPERISWVPGANGHNDFPVQNLPLGIFSSANMDRRAGVAIGDKIVDLRALYESVVSEDARAILEPVAYVKELNSFIARGEHPRIALRHLLFRFLTENPERLIEQTPLDSILIAMKDCTLHLPVRINNYTDFFAGVHHAENAARRRQIPGGQFPNYPYVPIAYHGRASSIRPSGHAMRRPRGQFRIADAPEPVVGPTRKLDFELEFGTWIASGNELGHPIDIRDAHQHIAGYCLSNDLSARDIQVWEAQPLGPFLAKNFGTVVSPWLITPEAIAPFRTARRARGPEEPAVLQYLDDTADAASGGVVVNLEVWLSSRQMRSAEIPATCISATSTRELYWTAAQMIAHHTIGGCDLQPGDLLGSGTISGTVPASGGSMIELTNDGASPVEIGNGELRAFLEDGDEVVFVGRCHRQGFASIGFGECRAVIH
ncbi:fumarylacetoacetase [Paraburkholderia sp. J12]|uniref:fumarylacetoacetase n=1 Tax=Paraburkholderia sp. J12 TaxID=2805432 RepID=UPI002ABDA68A|nr:fumarylacetoacetase [Paraburkholderia sp. J12]